LALISAVTFTNTTPSYAVTISSTFATNVGVDSNAATTVYPLGNVDSSEPSGYDPPSANAMSGYTMTYSNDFTGTTLPSGWTAYSGTAAGDPGSLWAPSQVKVSGGMLQLTTSQLPADNNDWVSGGAGQSGEALTYGAFFVRSRMTGVGPTQVELLWPTGGWPPEVDFDETYGGDTLTQATLHYTSANLTIHNNLTIDMTQWHTFGIVWSPASIIFTVDGTEWASITTTSVIPDQPMGLDIQQQTWCSSGLRVLRRRRRLMSIGWLSTARRVLPMHQRRRRLIRQPPRRPIRQPPRPPWRARHLPRVTRRPLQPIHRRLRPRQLQRQPSCARLMNQSR